MKKARRFIVFAAAGLLTACESRGTNDVPSVAGPQREARGTQREAPSPQTGDVLGQTYAQATSTSMPRSRADFGEGETTGKSQTSYITTGRPVRDFC